MKVEKLDTFSGHRDSVYALQQGESDRVFYSAGGDGFVVRWDLGRPDFGDLIARLGNSVYAMASDPQTGILWVGQNYEGVQLINPLTKERTGSLKLTHAPIFDMKLSGNTAFIGTGDGVLIVVDTSELAVKQHIKLSDKSIRSISINETSGHIAVGLSDWRVVILESKNYTPVYSLQGHTNSVFSSAYSVAGDQLLSAGRDAQIRVWDVSDGYNLVTQIPAHMYAINHLSFSRNGRHFATCSMDKSIKLWRNADMKLLKVLDRSRHAGHGTSVNKLLWMQEDSILISASDDRMISVWKIVE